MFEFIKSAFVDGLVVVRNLGFSRSVVWFLAIYAYGLTSCNSGKMPCPSVGGKPKFALFRKKADPAKPNEAGFGQTQSVGYHKNGLIKKKSYKSLKHKPKRIKIV